MGRRGELDLSARGEMPSAGEWTSTSPFNAAAEAEAAPNEQVRRSYLEAARHAERAARTQRIWPMSIWLWGMYALLSLLPWTILTRTGHPAIGVVAGIAAAILLWIGRSWWFAATRWTSGRTASALPGAAGPPLAT